MSEKGQGDSDSLGPADDADDAPETPLRVDAGLALDETGNEITLELPSEFILDSAAGGAIDADSVGTGTTPPTAGTPGGRFDEGPRIGEEDTDKPST